MLKMKNLEKIGVAKFGKDRTYVKMGLDLFFGRMDFGTTYLKMEKYFQTLIS